jgi:hypothetical protein
MRETAAEGRFAGICFAPEAWLRIPSLAESDRSEATPWVSDNGVTCRGLKTVD